MLRRRSVTSLPSLAQQIRAEHAAFTNAVSNAATHALRCGRALVAARQCVPEGQWTAWVRKHCEIGERHVRRYIALVKAFDATGHSESGDLVGLSLNGMIRKLTPPATRRLVRPLRQPTKPEAQQYENLSDVLAWWFAAPSSDRTRFISNIGWRRFEEAMPAAWWPTIETAVEARRPKQAAPAVYTGDLAAPADLGIPVFLRRAAP